MTPFTQRLNFIKRLDGMTEEARAHLLRIEDTLELGALWKVAMGNGYNDVAGSIEVVSDGRVDTQW